MSKMSQTIAILGVVAGLGVAALPLSTYADATPKSTNVPLSLEVGEVLEITTNNMEGEGDAAKPGTVVLTTDNASAPANYASDGTFAVIVKSNIEKGYNLTIKGSTGTGTNAAAKATDLASATDVIAAGDLTGTGSSWAYKGGLKTAWTAVTASDADGVIYTGSKDVAGDLDITNGKSVPVTFGANVVASQAAGTYTGQVTFTATAVTE